jgi:hypothetical protein
LESFRTGGFSIHHSSFITRIAKQRWLVVSKEYAVLLVSTFALLSTSSGQIVAEGMQIKELRSVAGIVTDQQGNPIQGATVSLIELTAGVPKTAVTDEDGCFTLALDTVTFDLQLSAPGFAVKSVHGKLGGDRRLDLGKLALTIQIATAEVTVSVTEEELAEEEVKAEEQQRILGVIPNFFVTYNPNAVPLHAKQKYELALKTLIDPETIGVDIASSGFQQAAGGLKGYGTGPGGYAKRFGSSFGTGSVDTMLGSAVLPSLFKQDPRYFYKGTGSVKQRALYAIGMSVLCKGDNGHWQYNYSGLLGGLAAGGISNLYSPAANRNNFGLTFENTAIGIGSSAISNLLQEFVVRKFTRSARHQP